MKLREHMGSLPDSLGTTVTVPPTAEGIAEWVSLIWNREIKPEQVRTQFYGHDNRLGGDGTYLVLVKNEDGAEVVFGFSDEGLSAI